MREEETIVWTLLVRYLVMMMVVRFGGCDFILYLATIDDVMAVRVCGKNSAASSICANIEVYSNRYYD